jgi:hypothetical protein
MWLPETFGKPWLIARGIVSSSSTGVASIDVKTHLGSLVADTVVAKQEVSSVLMTCKDRWQNTVEGLEDQLILTLEIAAWA